MSYSSLLYNINVYRRTKWTESVRNNNLGPTVQTLDSAIHQINHYLMDKYYKNQLHFPVDSAIHLLNNWGLEWVTVQFSIIHIILV